MGHRRIVCEDDARLPGYERSTEVYLALAAAPPAPEVEVEAVAVGEVLAAIERYLLTDPDNGWARADDVRAQMLRHHADAGRGAARERVFAARIDGEIVAWAKLWQRDGVAQVEDVVCLLEHRGRGLGRAVVAAAARTALGDELVFIVADGDDWPIALYRRLGFAEVGSLSVLDRHEPGFAWGAPLARPSGA